jgi:inorganic pyrophosphatase
VLHASHDVSPGKELPRDFQAVIEIPLGSTVKHELDKASGLLKVDRERAFGSEME